MTGYHKQFEKNGDEIVRVSLNQFKGENYCEFRVFFRDDQGEWKPTKKGVCLSVELLDELLEAIQGLQEFLQR